MIIKNIIENGLRRVSESISLLSESFVPFRQDLNDVSHFSMMSRSMGADSDAFIGCSIAQKIHNSDRVEFETNYSQLLGRDLYIRHSNNTVVGYQEYYWPTILHNTYNWSNTLMDFVLKPSRYEQLAMIVKDKKVHQFEIEENYVVTLKEKIYTTSFRGAIYNTCDIAYRHLCKWETQEERNRLFMGYITCFIDMKILIEKLIGSKVNGNIITVRLLDDNDKMADILYSKNDEVASYQE